MHGMPESVCLVMNADTSSTGAVYEIVGGAQNVLPADIADSMSKSVAMLQFATVMQQLGSTNNKYHIY